MSAERILCAFVGALGATGGVLVDRAVTERDAFLSLGPSALWGREGA